MSERVKTIGEGISRIDGILKVTGKATYTMDFPVSNVAYGFLVKSEIASGKILDIDTSAAEKSAGVVAIITHKNSLKIASGKAVRGGAMLQDANINFFGQNIGIVVAETFEQARTAARLIKVKYEKTDAKTDFEKSKTQAVKLKDREDHLRATSKQFFRTPNLSSMKFTTPRLSITTRWPRIQLLLFGNRTIN